MSEKNSSTVLKTMLLSFSMLLLLLIFLEIASWYYIAIIRGNKLSDHYFGGSAFEFFTPSYIRLRPNASGSNFEINSEGLVGDEFLSHSDKQINVVAIGGSTSFGNDNYLARIADRFRNTHTDLDFKVNFASAGTPGFSTLQSLVNFQTRVVPLNPDVVIIYHGVNDLTPLKIPDLKHQNMIEYNIRTNNLFGTSPNFRDTLLDKSHFYTLIYNRLLVINRNLIEKTYNIDDIDKMNSFESNMSAIIGISRANDAATILATFAHNEPKERERTTNWGFVFPEEATAYGIAKHNDSVRRLAEKHDLPIAEVSTLTGEKDLFRDFVHMTSEGTERMADILYPHVEKAILSKMNQFDSAL